MTRATALLAVLVLAPLGCAKQGPASTPPGEAGAATDDDALAGKPVVRNVEARPGDVTLCPYSGRKFLVTESSPRWEYEGESYVFCHEKALTAVQADPEKYFADFEG